MKRILLAIAIGLVLSTILTINSNSIHADLSDNLVRLHVIANSDSDIDQSVKLKVRDRIIDEMGRYFETAENAQECKAIVLENMDMIVNYANDELKKCNAPYSARAYFGNFDFPTKVYGNIALPKGKYDAVRIELGGAGGQNWWCVMFPPMCFVEESKGKIDEKGNKLLKKNLDEESYDIITNGDKLDVEVRFKIVEMLGGK